MSNNSRLQTPADALDYKNEAIVLWKKIRQPLIQKWTEGPISELIGGETEKDWMDTLGLMTRAIPTLWKKEFAQVATAGARQLAQQKLEVPRWEIPPEGRWHMVSGSTLLVITIDGRPCPIDSILVAPVLRHQGSGLKTFLAIRLFSSYAPHDGGTQPPFCSMVVDHPWPSSPEEFQRIRSEVKDGTWAGEVNTALLFVVAAETFLSQTVFKAEPAKVERHALKRAARTDTPPTIHVVRLRKTTGDSGQAEHSADIEWTCRWMVRGHWRQQFHPSTGTHETIWIMPHIKGPEDKPFRRPLPEVAAVVR